MAKDPAFLFYPNDWLGGTMGMTFEAKGAYVELLMLQFNRGHMTKHMIGQAVGHLWVNIEDKFRMDKDGLYYNVRLDLEKEKRKNYSKSRRNNLSGKNQHTKKGGHMTSHMENVNVNEDLNKDVSIKKVFNTMPISENFNGLPEIKIGASKELLLATQRVNATTEQINLLWNVFKVQHLNGETFYKSEDKVYSHFINWVKTQKIENATNKSNTSGNSKNAGIDQLLERINNKTSS